MTFILTFCVELICFCVPGAPSCIEQQVTQNEDITSAIIKPDHVSMKRMQKATALRTAPTVPLLMDHMTCAAPSMISGVPNWTFC